MGITNADLSTPFGEWAEIDVTFPASANTDVPILHTLNTPREADINYIPIRKDRACDVYHDTSATRRVWQDGTMFLRSNTASARVTLLLYVGRPKRRVTF